MKLKVGDEVWYSLPKDHSRKWVITSIWDTHTEDGLVAHLSRPDETKKLGMARCFALVTNLAQA